MKLLLPVFFTLICHNALVKVYIHTITRVITYYRDAHATYHHILLYRSDP